jgi:S-adenosyl-L-methionine hydrolase (adenosine-forming)
MAGILSLRLALGSWFDFMTVPIITLLTDFGLEDPYVASMKGVILEICPAARLVDISHLVPPQDVRTGAFMLASAYRDFPSGTIHLAVIDPGVGSSRRGLATKLNRGCLVGPDNGLFSLVLREESGWEAYSLEHPVYWRPTVSPTFHGRDIFAPVAAHLAMGLPVQALGPPCTPEIPAWADATVTGEEIEGEIIHIDHFGNAVTNVSRETFERFAAGVAVAVLAGDRTITAITATYADADVGRLIVLIGSSDRLEIAVNQGNAAMNIGLRRGDLVRVLRLDHRLDKP